MPIRPDVGDDIEFLDEIPALPVLADDALDLVDDLAQPPMPILAEQRTDRWFLRGLAPDVRGEAA